MKAFNILVTILSGYVLIIAFGVINLEAFNLAIMTPIKNYDLLVKQREFRSHIYHPSFHAPQRTDEKNVTIHNPDSSYTGHTFYIGAGNKTALLTDMNGDIQHRWDINPKEIWRDNKDHSAHHSLDHHLACDRAFLSPETGEIYAFITSRSPQAKKSNLGLVKLDKNAQPIWVYDAATVHHDIAFSNDQKKLYVLGKKFRTQHNLTFPNITPPYLDETILILNQNGEEIKHISLFDIFEKSHFKAILERITAVPTDPIFPHGDILHSNTIEVVPKEADGKA
ncbi:MAG: aryl-sulfate sulfotransferase, partial [Alphaproteobacteria bacterium]